MYISNHELVTASSFKKKSQLSQTSHLWNNYRISMNANHSNSFYLAAINSSLNRGGKKRKQKWIQIIKHLNSLFNNALLFVYLPVCLGVHNKIFHLLIISPCSSIHIIPIIPSTIIVSSLSPSTCYKALPSRWTYVTL